MAKVTKVKRKTNQKVTLYRASVRIKKPKRFNRKVLAARYRKAAVLYILRAKRVVDEMNALLKEGGKR
jgi:hypothetical protein